MSKLAFGFKSDNEEEEEEEEEEEVCLSSSAVIDWTFLHVLQMV